MTDTTTCPFCQHTVKILRWNRDVIVGSEGSTQVQVPSPTATVALDCGHSITGEAGAAIVDATLITYRRTS